MVDLDNLFVSYIESSPPSIDYTRLGLTFHSVLNKYMNGKTGIYMVYLHDDLDFRSITDEYWLFLPDIRSDNPATIAKSLYSFGIYIYAVMSARQWYSSNIYYLKL